MPSPRPPTALDAGLLTMGTVGPPPSLTATSTQSSPSIHDTLTTLPGSGVA